MHRERFVPFLIGIVDDRNLDRLLRFAVGKCERSAGCGEVRTRHRAAVGRGIGDCHLTVTAAGAIDRHACGPDILIDRDAGRIDAEGADVGHREEQGKGIAFNELAQRRRVSIIEVA